MPDLRMIPYEQLVEPPFPMREQFGDIPFAELCESIQASGVKQPILVRPVNGHFEVMDGHRRYKAAGVCALALMPCLVEECDDKHAVETMVAANLGREDVTATEEGRYYLGLMERFGLSEEALCTLVKKKSGYVTERIALVQLDPEIAEAVLQKAISYSAAKEILRVNPYTAALVLRCHVEKLSEEQLTKIERHRAFLLDLCVRCGATAKVAQKYVDQWKVALLPENAFVATDPAVEPAPHTHTRLPRCLACGRDADPQNMLELKLHYYEKDKVFKVLRDAGLELYE